MIYVGIDVSKDKHDCTIISSDGEILMDASNDSGKQRACSALDAVSLGTVCILQVLTSKKHEPFGSVICAHFMNQFLHICLKLSVFIRITPKI